MEYIIAHDVGTSGYKAVITDVAGKVIATAYEGYPTYYPHPLFAEQDVEDWWRAVVNTTHQEMEISGARPQDILALSFSSQMLNTIPVDGEGSPHADARPRVSLPEGVHRRQRVQEIADRAELEDQDSGGTVYRRPAFPDTTSW